MRQRHRIGFGIALAALAVTALATALNGNPQPAHAGITHLVSKTKTICVGRFLIDIPLEARFELIRPRMHGFDIATFAEPVSEFRTRLAHREAEIRAKPDRLGGNNNLELVREIKTDRGLIGKMFVHSRTVTEGTAGNGVEIERYRYEGVAVEALVHGEGVSIDLGSDNYFPDKSENLYRLVAQLAPNPGNRIPSEPGYCIDRAYVRDPSGDDLDEQITMFAKFPSHPDVDLMLLLAAGLEPDENGLLKRGAAAESRLSIWERFRVSRLRAAAREINGLAGEELVRRAVEQNGVRAYSFWWEVNGTNNDVQIPHLVFTMTTGKNRDGPVQTSMSETEALALWDKISSSIRLRSKAPAHTRPPLMRSNPEAQ